MSKIPAQIVQILWNYCTILRDDRLSYGVVRAEQRLSRGERFEVGVSANLEHATRPRPSILQEAFKGNLLTARIQ